MRPEMAAGDEFQRPTAECPDAKGLNESNPPGFVTIARAFRLDEFVIDQLLNYSACP
jgi:hypothetical protein